MSGKKIIRGLKEAVRHAKGEKTRVRVHARAVPKAAKKPRTRRAAKSSGARGAQKKGAAGKNGARRAARDRLTKAQKAEVRQFVETPEWRDRMLKHIDASFPHLVVLFISMTHARDALKRNAKDWPNWVSDFTHDYVTFQNAFTTGMPDPRPPKMRG